MLYEKYFETIINSECVIFLYIIARMSYMATQF